MKFSNKKQETIDSLKQETINLKEPINNLTRKNNEEPMDDKLMMVSNILKEPTMNNKKSLISDILNKSIINDIINQTMGDGLEEKLINNTLKHSMTYKNLAQPINNEGYLIKEPAINNILTCPMNINLK